MRAMCLVLSREYQADNAALPGRHDDRVSRANPIPGVDQRPSEKHGLSGSQPRLESQTQMLKLQINASCMRRDRCTWASNKSLIIPIESNPSYQIHT